MDGADGQNDGVATMKQCLGAGLTDDECCGGWWEKGHREDSTATQTVFQHGRICTVTITTTIVEMTTAMGKQRSTQM